VPAKDLTKMTAATVTELTIEKGITTEAMTTTAIAAAEEAPDTITGPERVEAPRTAIIRGEAVIIVTEEGVKSEIANVDIRILESRDKTEEE